MEKTPTATPADYPTRSRTTHTLDYHSQHVAVSRATLLADVPGIPEVELDSLLSAILPDVSTDRTLGSISEEIEKRYIVNRRWSFLEVNPQKKSDRETKIYDFIRDIFNCIVSIAELSDPRVECIINGNQPPLSQRTNISRPDGYVQLSIKSFPLAGGDSWADIVMPMEFKKSSTAESANDNFAKVVWSMRHTMRNDPRRRFVFGLTVEDTNARLWFNDRCGIVSSTAFDLNEGWKYFVQIVLGITRATLEELGYDPGLKLAKGATLATPRYDIAIYSPDKPQTIYRTVGLISEVGAESLIGRGTRVWTVQKLDTSGSPSGPLYALKDVWVHDDRPAEHDVIAKIIALDNTYPRYFLTVMDAGFALGHSHSPSPVDHTKNVIRRGQDFVATGQVLRPAEMRQGSSKSRRKCTSISSVSKRSRTAQSVPNLPDEGHWDHVNVNRFPRQHYRIVFEEIGIPLYDLRDYQDVIIAIEGGLKGWHAGFAQRSRANWVGLEAIHEAKYVHRDVSAGNILLISDKSGGGKRGVIIDLEYINKIDSESTSHGVKIGTYEFMAIEVARSCYLHFPEDMIDPEETPAPMLEPALFQQNQLHDLESVWWICVWTIFQLVWPNTNSARDLVESYEIAFRSHDARCAFWQSEFKDPATHLLDNAIRKAMGYWCQQLRKAYRESYSAGDLADINGRCLEAARKAQTLALKLIYDATKSYPSGLRFLSELEELPKTEERPIGKKNLQVKTRYYPIFNYLN